jgi:PAS domain S-box-containing protein
MKDDIKKLEALKKSASALAEQNARADALFRSIGDGLITTEESGKVDRVNKIACQILGRPKKDLIGKWFPKAVKATDEYGNLIPHIDRPITQAMITGKPVHKKIYYERGDGVLVPVSLTASPIILDNRPIGSIQLFRDITEELEIDKTKSEFISIASHQLRTPATAVKNYLGMLKEGFAGELTEQQKQFAELAYTSNERQIAIVNDLLYVAKTESSTLILKRQAIDLTELVKDVITEQMDSINQRKQTIQTLAPEHKVLVNLDMTYFRMVVENLINNASKYTPEGGKIKVVIRTAINHVLLAVADTGVGIDPADTSKLFRKFSRIDNPLSATVGGSGIGLYLIKKIIDIHGGMISVKSKPGKGSVFSVKLPVSSSA